MSLTALSQAREDARFRIFNYVTELSADEGDDQDSRGLFAISWEHRQLAICRLLQDGDSAAFQLGLRRSGLTWLHLLTRMAQGMQAAPSLRLGSTWDCVASAIAAGDLKLAQQIADRFPGEPDLDREYLDDYMPLAMMSRLVRAPDDRASIEALGQRWEQAEDGSSTNDIPLWMALADRDIPAFQEAFSAVIERRRDQMVAYRKSPGGLPTTAATEGAIYIDGLAILQLAQSLGMNITTTFGLCPKVARVSSVHTELPNNSWMAFD